MMKPRSAPVTSIAESSTSASTSSRTRPRAERAQALEQRGNLPQVADAPSWWPCPAAGAAVGEQEHQLGAAAAAQPDPIAVRERRTR